MGRKLARNANPGGAKCQAARFRGPGACDSLESAVLLVETTPRIDRAMSLLVIVVIAAVSLIPFAFAYLNGAVLMKVFRGRTNIYMSTGLAFAALGFLLAGTLDIGWAVWVILIIVPMGMANSVLYGTLTAYWSALLGPRATGTATGLVTAAQIACSLVLIASSGSWFNLGAAELAQLAPVFIVGAVLLALAAVLVLLARRITITAAPSGAGGH